MTRRGEKRTADLEADLACPICDYSLRGLDGRVVTCPECGASCDRAAMIAGRWDGAWYEAPGYSRLLWPAAWLLCSGVGALITFSLAPSGLAFAVGALACGGGWILSLLWIRRDLKDGTAVPLALLAHLLLVGYLIPVPAVIMLFVTTNLLSAPGSSLAMAFMLGVVIAMIWACRRGEKFIAGRCIANHLLRAATSEKR